MDDRDIEGLVNGIGNVEKRLDSDVGKMCTLLQELAEEIFENRSGLPKQDTDLLREYFHDIYKSLKLHLVFHSGADLFDAPTKLQVLGSLIGLNDDELERQPDENSALEHCADPWSKLLEIISAITAQNPEERDHRHAETVMATAKDLLEALSSKNIFKPIALAVVSHNDQWSVGSSIAVSHFLRPLCLLRRIGHFKHCLKKAIVSNQPLETENNQNWSSQATRTGKGEASEKKPPCPNCTTMFANLEGFIKRNTFLGACAEYCPVDRLLADRPLSDEENNQINNALEQNERICKRYFKNFQEIKITERDGALAIIRVVFKEHLFGLRPQCNDHFGDRSRCPYIERLNDSSL